MMTRTTWQAGLAAVALVAIGSLTLLSSALAAPVAGGTLDPTTVPKYVTPLVIPPVMPASTASPAPAAKYDIAVRQFQQQILPGGIWNTLSGRTDPYGPTTVWSYGRAEDPLPDSTALGGGAGVAPAPNSTFNYPAFTVENTSRVTTTVRWINDLVDPATGNYRPHLFAVDQTLHWANPTGAGCMPATATGTDCMTMNPAPYTGPVPLVTHVHGSHVNPDSDGYPEAWWLPGAPGTKGIPANYVAKGSVYTQANNANAVPGSAYYGYANTQPAGTLWYHDHALGMTRLNVYAGPAGFWLIRGGANDLAAGILPGPAPGLNANGTPQDVNDLTLASVRNQIREIPVAIQDRSFDYDPATGATSLFYPTGRAFFEGLNMLGQPQQFPGAGVLNIPFIDPTMMSDISPIWNPEVFFNTMVVNGTTWPKLDVAPERYRLRLLNGCNSRTLNLSMQVVTGPGPDGVYGMPDVNGVVDDILGAEIPFYQIGAEQGFLPQVVMIRTGFATPLPGNGTIPAEVALPDPAQALLMGPAERADVIVDFSGLANGTRVRIFNTGPDAPFGGFVGNVPADPGTTGQVMDFVVNTALPAGAASTPPQNLILPAEGALGAASNTRQLSLNEMVSNQVCVEADPVTGAFIGFLFNTAPNDPTFAATCAAYPVTIPGNVAVPFAPRQAQLGIVTAGMAVPMKWADPITEFPLLNSTEVWEVFNTTVDAHPIHLHLVRFNVVDRQNIDTMTLAPIAGTVTPPLPNEAGYKDTVVAYPGQVTRVKAKFDIAGRYVWHCHIVEHEDNEMMRPFEVLVPCGQIRGLYGPTASTNGSYRIYWEASYGTSGVTYVLTENNVEVYRGPNRYVDFTGKPDGSYSYAVKAVKAGLADSPVQGPLTTSVTLACATPTIYGPTSSTTATYRINWRISSTPGVTYVLTENGTEIYRGTGYYKDVTQAASGSYVYVVKAIKAGYADSATTTLTTGVTLTCGIIRGLYGPTANTTGSYRIYWEASYGTASPTYVLYENGVEVYRGPNRYKDFTAKPNGGYSYTVQAVKAGYVDSAVKGTVTTTVTR
jgi:FtsP/CotA-like multicopper oxidase with cupredoxin domain